MSDNENRPDAPPSLRYLPERFRQAVQALRTWKIPPRLVFLTIGLLATLWFLIRVIPKPARAGYPCMRATAPVMSGFVMYLVSVAGSVAAMRRSRDLFAGSRSLLATAFLALAVMLFLFSVIQSPLTTNALRKNTPAGYFPPNQPIGHATGIFPGRVTWIWDPRATNEHCTNTSNENGILDDGDNAWFQAKNNDAAVIDSMVLTSLLALTGTTTAEKAWDTLFRYFNVAHGLGNTGYVPGRKILVKINETSAYGGPSWGRFDTALSRTDHLALNNFASETDPYVVLSVLRQLIHKAGVPGEMIYVGDPARNIYKEFYDLWHGEFPQVHILGNNLIHPELNVAVLGRTPVAVTSGDRVFFSDSGKAMPDAVSDKLFTIFDEIDYLINIPTLKAHATAGITLAAKNHFGSFTREWAVHLHKGLMDGVDDPVRLGYGLYRIQTDIMMHRLLSGKTLLFLVDGLYPGADAVADPDRWNSIPFSGDWCSSLFMSLDPVAVESVCHDFLRSEYNGPTPATSRPNWYGVDDYLHQAADSSLWPDGVRYDPDRDDVVFASLGVHEHWNDSLNKQYSRNLGIGTGIELVKVHESSFGYGQAPEVPSFRISPVPASDHILLSNPSCKKGKYEICDLAGTILACGELDGRPRQKVMISHCPAGLLLLRLPSGSRHQTVKFIKY